MHSVYLSEKHASEWISNGTISGSASVISDNPDQILSEECDCAPHDMDVATGSIEEVQADEAPTKTEAVAVVRYDISTRVLIIISIVIGIQVVQILSSCQKHL